MDMTKLREYQNLYHSELFDHVLPFWMKYSPDHQNGGIYTCLDRVGKIYSTDKSVWAQGRTAWLFSNLCNIYPEHQDKAEWLEIARSCINFLNRCCIDNSDGRMYFTVTNTGEPLRKRRYFFSEAFYVMGCAEYARASGDLKVLDQARQYYKFIDSIFDNAGNDPYKITPKVIRSTRDTISLANPMILLNMTSVMRKCDPSNISLYDERANKYIDYISDNFVRPDLHAVLESAGSDGTYQNWYSAGRIVNPGHSIETSWFLHEQGQYFERPDLIELSRKIFNWSIDRGWDRQYGGILYFTDVEGFPVEQYEHDMKLWWPHCEALVASLMIYKNTKDSKYLEWFEKITEYSFRAFSDKEYGEWFGYLRRDGIPTEPSCKGSTYKSGYHVIRMLIMVTELLKEMQFELQVIPNETQR